MSQDSITIGDAELEIMKVIWKAGVPINSTSISEAVKDKGWKRTTISTFLARLVEKGALSAEKKGKLFYYTPLISARSYKKSQIKAMIKNLFDGSAGALAVSLFEDEKFTDKDLRELKAIFEDKENKL